MQVGEEAPQRLLSVAHTLQSVIGQHQSVEAGVHPPKLPHFSPVLQVVVCDLQQAQRRAGGPGFGNSLVAVQAQKKLSESDDKVKKLQTCSLFCHF